MLLRTKLAAGLAFAVTITGAAVPAHANPPRHDRTSALEARRVDRVDPRMTWTPCFEIAECATATVPLDYDRPDGPTTQLAVLRVKARDQANKIGSLFVNPGGPGGSATAMALGAPGAVADELRDRFDFIGVDPRGIAMSANMQCWKTATEQEEALEGIFVSFPVTRAEERAYVAASERIGRACSTTGRPLSGAMSTAEVARDMDVVRRAVGDKALTFLGFSYGSALGQYYANLFPDRVRAVVVDGILDPVSWTGVGVGRYRTLDERLHSADGAYRALREVLRRCDRAGERYCVFAAGDPWRNWVAITRELLREPLVIEDENGTFRISYADFVAANLGILYGEDAGAELTRLAAEIQALLADRSDPAAQARVVSRITAARAAADEPPPYDNSPEAGTAVICTDTKQPRDAEAWIPAADRADRRAPFFGRFWNWVDSACAEGTWTVQDEDAYLGPFNKRTIKPLLFVGNYWDPATNYDSSVSSSARMPGARLLSSNNWGHTAYLTSECTTAAVDAYLLSGTLPPRGKTCTDSAQPFTEPLSAAAAKRKAAGERLPVATPKPKSVLTGGR